MTGSAVTDNTATGGNGGGAGAAGQTGGAGGTVDGAGISDNGPPLTLSVASSLISDNQAVGGDGGEPSGAGTGGSGGPVLGGGLYVSSSSATTAASITGTLFLTNSATAGTPADDYVTGGTGGASSYAGGAGLFATGSFPLSVISSTFEGNQSVVPNAGGSITPPEGEGGAAEGGGLYLNDGPAATIVNSTVFGNTAESGTGSGTVGAPVGSFGGGIDLYSNGPATTVGLYSDTIAGNSATSGFETNAAEFGANLVAIGAPITLQDTAIADPKPSGAPNCASQGGTFDDSGRNLEDSGSTSTCGLSKTLNDQLVTSAGLPTALGDNGGPTVGDTGATGVTGVTAPTGTLAPALGSALIGNGGICTNPLAPGAGMGSFPVLTTDERGDPRPATCDIGAFQTEPLTVTGAPTITGTRAVGQSLNCATGTFATAGDGVLTSSGSIGAPTIGYTWTSNGTTVSTSNSYTVAASDLQHTLACTETATGAYGHGSATSAPVKIVAGSTKIAIGSLTQAHRKWAEKKRKHGPPIGTSFTYTLNAPATATLEFQTKTKGRKVKHKCVAQNKKNKHAPSCTLIIIAGTIKHTSTAGKNTITFTGKIGRHKLAPGKYTLVLAAHNSTGTATKTLTFTITR